MDNRPLSEQIYEAWTQYADSNAAASLLEETKSANLSRMILEKYPTLAINRAEALVKASDEWSDWVETMVQARQKANRARARIEYLKALQQERISEEANARLQAKL